MPAIAEVSAWLGRIMAILPELVGLWNAVKAQSSTDGELAASLDLVRAVKRRQAEEEMAP